MNVDECLRGHESSTHLQYALSLRWLRITLENMSSLTQQSNVSNRKEDGLEIVLSDGHGVEASLQNY